MDHAARLADHFFQIESGELLVGGTRASVLAKAYGTPFFAYDASVLEYKWNLLRATLPPEFSICYSVKANPNQTILRYFLSKGVGLEIASAGEFFQALSSGCQPNRILFAGPGKTESELQCVISKGIGEIHLESLLEAERIEAISSRLGIRTRVAVRVNPGGDAEGGAMRMGGRSAPFGVDEEQLGEILDRICACEHLAFSGIHLFLGTQILDASILATQYRKGIEIARYVSSHMHQPLRTLDFGGGLGIPYFPHESELDMKLLEQLLDEIVAETRSDPAFAATQFVVEPGRYLVGEAGIYITRVNDIKVSRGKKFLVVDGGMNHHLAASGNLGQTIKRNYPLAVLNKVDSSDKEMVDVVGPLCTPLDVLARGVCLPKAEVGDWIGVFQSGAYARSASPLGFLSHATPPEVWTEAGEHRLIRRRGELSDFLRDQMF